MTVLFSHAWKHVQCADAESPAQLLADLDDLQKRVKLFRTTREGRGGRRREGRRFAADPDEHGRAVDAGRAGGQEDGPFDIMAHDVEGPSVADDAGPDELADFAGPEAVAHDGPKADGATQEDVLTKRTRPVGHVVAFTSAADALRPGTRASSSTTARCVVMTRKKTAKKKKSIITITHPQQAKLRFPFFFSRIHPESSVPSDG